MSDDKLRALPREVPDYHARQAAHLRAFRERDNGAAQGAAHRRGGAAGATRRRDRRASVRRPSVRIETESCRRRRVLDRLWRRIAPRDRYRGRRLGYRRRPQRIGRRDGRGSRRWDRLWALGAHVIRNVSGRGRCQPSIARLGVLQRRPARGSNRFGFLQKRAPG